MYTTVYDYISSKVKHLYTKDSNGKPVQDLAYSYDGNGNCTVEKDNLSDIHREFTYDLLNQLTVEKYYDNKGKLVESITYMYDNAGNRTKRIEKQDGEAAETNYDYNNKNQLDAINGKKEYRYDERGNMAANGELAYVYNDRNQLVEVKQDGKTGAAYKYDEKGVRTEKKVERETEKYNYRERELTSVGDKDNNVKYFFTRNADGKLINMIDYTDKKPTAYWYLHDAFGNITKAEVRQNSR